MAARGVNRARGTLGSDSRRAYDDYFYGHQHTRQPSIIVRIASPIV